MNNDDDEKQARVTGMTSDADVIVGGKEKAAFALGEVGNNMAQGMTMNFSGIFMTDVALINPALTGTIRLVCTLWDAVNDPLVGSWADNTLTKRGRYKPWLFMALPLLILNVLCYIVLPGQQGTVTQAVYIFLMQFIYVLFYTMVFTPYDSSMSSITTNAESRAQVGSVRFVGAFGGQVIVSFMALPLVMLFEKRIPTTFVGGGYTLAAIIFSLIAIPCYILCYKIPKERLILDKSVMQFTWKQRLTVFMCKPYVCAFLSFFCWGLHASMFAGNRAYFYKYNMGNFSLFTGAAVLWSGGMMVGAILFGIVAKRVKNKKYAVMFFWGVSAVLALAMSAVPDFSGVFGIHWLLTFLIGVGDGAGLTGVFSMIPDVSEFVQYHKGIRPSGFIGSSINFMNKMGMTIGSAFSGYVLAWTGYVANAEVQSGAALTAIHTMEHLVPGILSAIGVLAISFYPMSNALHAEILKKLEKGEYAPGVTPMTGSEAKKE
jgi:sugar (glycoside-pentoside-hexuronide) transporter